MVVVGFTFVALWLSKLIQTQGPPSSEKQVAYECGERPVGPGWFNLNPRFYVVAIVFVIFDVEVAFMFPVGIVISEWVAGGVGLFAFVEVLVFVVLLLLGLAYVWVKGDIAWIKEIRRPPAEDESAPRQAA